MLISKTFDASVICPAEQTCVVDDPVYDELLAEFERMGAQVLTDAEVARLCEHVVADDGAIELAALGQSCLNLSRHRRLRRASRREDPARPAAV